MADLAESMMNLAWEHAKAQGKMRAGYAMKVWEVRAETFMKGCKSFIYVHALFEVGSSKVHVKEDKWVLIFFYPGFSFSLLTLTCLLSQCSSVCEIDLICMCCTFIALHCVFCNYEKTFWLLKPVLTLNLWPGKANYILNSWNRHFTCNNTSDFVCETGIWQCTNNVSNINMVTYPKSPHLW